MEDSILYFLKALIHQPGSGHTLFFNTTLFGVVFTLYYGLQLAFAGVAWLRLYFLLLFSLYFFYHFSGYFVFLLIATASVDYFCARGIESTPKRLAKQLFVALSITVNLGLLVYFKYTGFFISALNELAPISGAENFVTQIVMPIGLSFYTFKSISYIMDVYYEEPAEKNFLYYLTYLSFFPTTLAGPIIRSTDFLPQLHAPRPLEAREPGIAFFLFLSGLFKKTVVADYLLVNLVDRIYDNPTMFTGFENFIGTLGFGLQLFYDFSGYSEMAAGVALALGFRIVQNFNEPLKAFSISEFWRRWHISLSSWFNDYVFMPLNFSLRGWGKFGMVLAIMTTFLLSGLWHGPNWTFVLWGGAHGFALSYEALTVSFRAKLQAMLGGFYRVMAVIAVHIFLAFTYILFKSDSLTEAGLVLDKIAFDFTPEVALDWAATYPALAGLMAGAVALLYLPTEWKIKGRDFFSDLPWPIQALVGFIAVALIYQVRAADLQPFAYLKF